MVNALIRDSFFGQLVRLITNDRLLQYPEERDPSLWHTYINAEKSRNLALHGTPENHPLESAEHFLEHPNHEQSLTPQVIVAHDRGRVISYPKALDAGLSSVNPAGLNPKVEPYDSKGGHGGPPPVTSAQKSDSKHDAGDESRSSITARSPSRNSDATRVDVNPVGPYTKNEEVDEKKGRDVLLVDWMPHDPENPLNWSTLKKLWVTFELCLLTFSIYIGSAIYTAGILDVARVFDVSQLAATLGLCLFVAGYGLGPMLWSPMSEMPMIGRNPIYILTLAVFVLFQIPTALATNFGMLLAFRFLTGFFGSPALATGGASIGDMYRPSKRAYGIAVWGVSAICGPVLGPLVGGFASESKGWRWTIWELMWLSGFTFVVLFFFLPETSSANILYRRTRRLRKITGRSNLRCEPELIAEQMTGKDVAIILARAFTLNFQEPIVFLLNLYIALIYGLLYVWFESFAIVFVEIYGFSLGMEGLSFIGILCGALIVLPPFCIYLYFFQEPQFNENGELKPEERLLPAFVGAFCIPICLFWFGWTSRESVHWIVPIIGSSFFTIGAFLLFNSVLNYLGDAYPEYAASVFAGNDFMRSSFGAGFPLFAGAMYRNLGVGWASTLLALLSIVFIPIPFLLYKYGERIRHASKHARHDL